MDRLIFTAASGATRNLVQQQIQANNMANASHPGFRADLERASSWEVPGFGYSSRFQVNSASGGVDLSPGALLETGRDLDIALQGPGLIAVQNGRREVYTRNGNIDIDSAGRLSIGGKPLLGDNGPIQLPPFSQLEIGSDGTITIYPAGGDVMAAQEVDRVRLVNIPAAQLTKNEQGWLVSSRNRVPRDEGVKIVNRHTESSSVSMMDGMIETVALSRQFETQIKMMKAAETLAQAGNRLLRGG
ncbi:flagellar basal body rod protein FlgF [Pantoea sp. A4]|uniref:flagellar basal body rod protein FlgF n=1 Tax=Pantoea sp. A4 TaxID=1225184 RepID=UPI00036393A1|nr:flagellar basal body rod protein FlgF [Pantoea sp. A4]